MRSGAKQPDSCRCPLCVNVGDKRKKLYLKPESLPPPLRADLSGQYEGGTDRPSHYLITPRRLFRAEPGQTRRGKEEVQRSLPRRSFTHMEPVMPKKIT